METIESNIFSVDKCDDINGEYATFTDCRMLVDFGPVQKDTEWSCITISFNNKRVIEFFNEEGNIIYSIPYKLTPDL